MSSPKFNSTIPEHLLENQTPAMQFLMNELSKNTQATEYLLNKREESGVILEDIKKELGLVHEQTRKTNGTVLRHTKEIAELVNSKEDIQELIAVKKVVVKLGTSKLFWVSTVAFLFFGVQTGFFASILKWVFSSLSLT